MAKALTKSQIAAGIAEKVGLSKKQAVQSLEVLGDWHTRTPRTPSRFPAWANSCS
jgi:nucleoid DNA-binding protein